MFAKFLAPSRKAGISLFLASLFTKDINAFPQLDLCFFPVRLRSDLTKIVAHLPIRCSPMLARMVNIADVPFPVGSGRKKDQLLTFQEEDAILSVLFNYSEKGFWKLKFSLWHLWSSFPISICSILNLLFNPYNQLIRLFSSWKHPP